jgi:hypothetical protein
MERVTEVILVESEQHIPSIETIRSLPKDKSLKLLFGASFLGLREEIGKRLETELPEFKVAIHLIEPEINITQLITDEEINQHQGFFEQCAKDYRTLAQNLIFTLAKKLNVELDRNFPLGTFYDLGMPSGHMNEWKYYVHGFHCGFENTVTQQNIEVPLVFSYEFGDLDPYFFIKFIKSTKAYHPLPVKLYEDYADGVRILDKMLSLGKFEIVHSNVDNHYGVVVTDREKVEIIPYREENFKKRKPRFNLYRFLGLQ